jgi:hypothetical protein
LVVETVDEWRPRGTIRKRERGVLDRGGKLICKPGCDFGAPFEIVYQYDDLYVAHQHGCAAWSGRGETSWYPAEWHLFRAGLAPDDSGHMVVWEVLAKEEPGRKWRDCKARLIERLNGIAAKKLAAGT